MHIVAHGAKDQAGGRLADLFLADRRAGQRFAMIAIEAGIAGAGGIGVHPVALQGDPAGPEVALFEDMHADAPPLGGGDRGHMDLDAVVEDHQVGDFTLVDEPVDPGRPSLFLVTIGDAGAEEAPVRKVAAIEHDLADLEARLIELIGDLREKGAERTTQEQIVPSADRAANEAVTTIHAPPASPRMAFCFAVAKDAVQHRGHTVIPSSQRASLLEDA